MDRRRILQIYRHPELIEKSEDRSSANKKGKKTYTRSRIVISQTAMTTYGFAIERSSEPVELGHIPLLSADNVANTLDRRKREDPTDSESQQRNKKSRKDPTPKGNWFNHCCLLRSGKKDCAVLRRLNIEEICLNFNQTYKPWTNYYSLDWQI